MRYPKRLIEVDLPIKRISAHARREKSIRHGHICTLHIWWARRPLAACRAVICASLWPDPADPLCPQSFRDAAAAQIRQFANAAVASKEIAAICDDEAWGRYQAVADGRTSLDVGGEHDDASRQADLVALRGLLLDFIADGAAWEASTNKVFLQTARNLTQAAHEALGGAPGTRPLVVDPFAGGGAIPLEALRVGADAFASDLNPVAVLLNKVVLEYIPKYGQRLADEVRKWGQWVKEQAEKELAEFYPKGPDGATPIAYLWARTIKCEGPGCGAEVPLMRSLWLAKKSSRSVALRIVPRPRAKRVDFEIIEKAKAADVGGGTVARGSATCPCCGFTTPVASVRRQLKVRHGGARDARLLCVVTSRPNDTGRRYRQPSRADLDAVQRATDALALRNSAESGFLRAIPDESTEHYHTFVNRGPIYGMTTWADYFNARQLLAMLTLVGLTRTVGNRAAVSPGERDGLAGAWQTCLALAADRQVDALSSLCRWHSTRELHTGTFGRQALPMVWDYSEVYPFSGATGGFDGALEWVAKVLDSTAEAALEPGHAVQASATSAFLPDDSAQAVVTDPPYYYSVQYADLSDYFYVWLRRSLFDVHPELLASPLTPKDDEIIVQSPGDQYAASGKNNAYYESHMALALGQVRRVLQPSGVATVVFAHTSTAGWEAMLQATVDAGLTITASWPIDTEMATRVIAQGRSVLASSVHLICRPRENPDGSLRTDDIGDWRDVLAELPKRIHEWMPRLAAEGVVGADAIFACLGPALEIFSRYGRVEKASGEQVPLREYLVHVWAAVSQEALRMVFEGADASGFEEDARLTAMWLWTLKADTNGNGKDEDAEAVSSGGYVLEYDAARKIAQGLGAHLDVLGNLVEIKGDKARLLPVDERGQYLFGKTETVATTKRKRKRQQQRSLFNEMDEAEAAEGGWGEGGAPTAGQTTLDRVHQAMLLFASGRSAALKRFLVEEGIGRDSRFWTLAQALSALYPSNTQEKRWVDGLLARKKGLGF